MYYCIDNGSEINVDRKNVDDKEKYETSVEYEGWAENTNVTVNVYVEASHYFVKIDEKFSNIVTDATTYNFSTGSDSSIGDEPILVEHNYTLELLQKDQLPNTLNYKLPHHTEFGVPGFELLIFIISLIVVVLIFKYRKKDRRN